MNYENLLNFRDTVAYPAMKNLFVNTQIPEGFCCISDLSISFFDGRSCGHDSEYQAKGLIFKNGQVEEYSFCELDIDFMEFMDRHKDAAFLLDGKLQFNNELGEFALSTVMRSFDLCAKICPELESYTQLDLVPISSDIGIRFEKMKYLFAGDDYLGLNQETAPQQDTEGKNFVIDDELSVWHGETDVFLDAYLLATDHLVSRLKNEIDKTGSSEDFRSLDNINFYAVYNLVSKTIELQSTFYCFDVDGERQHTLSIPLSEDEKSELTNLLETYCKEQYNQSFFEVLQDAIASREESISDSAGIPQNESVWICVYKDALGHLVDNDNLTEICVPTEWLLNILKKAGEEPESWFNEYTADNTDDIARLALEEGVILDCSDRDTKRHLMSQKKASLDSKIFAAKAQSGENSLSVPDISSPER